MINMLIGAPGGGKSYEAVVFHILPALAKGRKVITNLPLALDAFPPEQRDLIDLRTATIAKPIEYDLAKAEASYKRFGRVAAFKKHNPRAFSNIEDYGDSWRHPDDGYGALYVIDECHLTLPRGRTPVAVAEWFSLHRHEFADLLLISQSHGKVDKDICDMVQTVYKVRKAVAFGSSGSYIRKVFDGLQGDNVNTSVRKYQSKYFKFYKSHTKSDNAGKEEGASDIVPFWRRWPIIGAALCFLVVAFMATRIETNPMKMGIKKDALANNNRGGAQPVALGYTPPPGEGQAQAAPRSASQLESSHQVVSVKGGAQPVGSSGAKHPLSGYGVHLAGSLQNKAKGFFYMFQVSQNGQTVYAMNSQDMRDAGYKITRLNDCLAKLTYENEEFVVMCDAPRMGVAPGSGVTNNGSAPPAAPSEQSGGSQIAMVDSKGYGVVGGRIDGVRTPSTDQTKSSR
jgi:zona occludens toxin